MPAKPLTPQQLDDARRLNSLFKTWQMAQRDLGKDSSQESAAAALKFNQSALSQYLNGKIPLNVEVAVKFARLINRKIDEFSPGIADEIADAYTFVRAPQVPREVMGARIETADELRTLTALRLSGELGKRAFSIITADILAKLEGFAANEPGQDAVSTLPNEAGAESNPHGLLIRRHSRKD